MNNPPKKISSYLTWLIIFSLFIIALYQVITFNWSTLFVLLQAITFALIPFFLEWKFKVYTPIHIKTAIVIFMFATLFLGEINNFYDNIWWWDMLLHGIAGFGVALIGFMILAIIYNKTNLKTTTLLTTIFAISFSIAISTVWEIYEFFVDLFFDTNMQPTTTDTMWDMVIATAGAIIASIFGWRYLIHKEGGIMEEIIKEGVEENN